MEHPLVIRLDKSNFDEIKNKSSSLVLYSNIISQPEINLGFHSYIHQTKNKMNLTSKINSKDKFYYIVNPFESNDLLLKKTSEFLKIKDSTPKILSRAFFKMWEMIHVFDLCSEKELTVATLAEGPGSFLQAILKYREKYHSVKNDKYYSITIHPEDGNNIEVSKNFLGYYQEKYPNLVVNHKTYKQNVASKYKSRDTGDLTDFKSISNFKKEITKGKKLANLVTADGGFAWKDENYQEQEAYPLIIGEIIAGLMVQDKGGHMVIKLFETFTKLSVKLMYLLSGLYEEVYFYKPYFSRVSNSEKYVICKNFIFDQKKDKNNLSVIYSDLEKILKQFDTDKYIIDILPELNVPNDFTNKIRLFNIQVANKQQVMINKIISYIKENNYFGQKYHDYLEKHNQAIDFWINNFLIENKQLKDFNDNIKKVLIHQDDELLEMNYIN